MSHSHHPDPSSRPNKKPKLEHDSDVTTTTSTTPASHSHSQPNARAGPSRGMPGLGPGTGTGTGSGIASRGRTRSYSTFVQENTTGEAGGEGEDDGDEEGEGKEYVGDPAGLEQHRKESIYLSFLSSRRQHSRAERNVRRLEREVKGLRDGAGVVEGMWNEVVRLLESVVQGGGTKMEMDDEYSLPPIISSLRDPSLPTQLQSRLPHLQSLLQRLPPSASSSSSSTYVINASLESAIKSLQAEKITLAEKYESAVDELEEARRKSDKWRMEFERLKAAGVGGGVGGGMVYGDEGMGGMRDNSRQGSEDVKMEGGEGSDVGRLMNQGRSPLGMNGDHQSNGSLINAANDNSILTSRLAAKDLEIEQLAADTLKFKNDMDFLREVAWNPTEEAVMASALWKTLKAQSEEQMTLATDARRVAEMEGRRADDLATEQERYKAAIEYQHKGEIDQYDKGIRARDADIARLRAARDGFREENDKLVAEKMITFKSIQDVDTLVQIAEEKFKSIQLELERLQSRTAADVGEKGYLNFLLNKSPEEMDYVRSLENRITEATDREKALQEQVKAYMGDRDSVNMTGLMRSESRAREETEKWKRLYHERESAAKNGPQASLLSQLAEKSQEIEKLKIELQQRDASMNATFDQVTHLSNALGQAETVAKSHVDHIKKMEMAAHDAITVKSKAEHKYFAECRKSGALMENQGVLQKTVEAQRVALEKSRTTEDSLHAQLAAQEREIVLLKNTIRTVQTQQQRLETELVRYKAEAEESARRAEGRDTINKERLEEIKVAQAEVRALKNENDDLNRKIKKQETIAKKAGGNPSVPQNEVALIKENEMLKTVLKCSSCKDRFRTTVLTTCFHTFCAECISARLTNRNRKCNSCMKPFSYEDVKTLHNT